MLLEGCKKFSLVGLNFFEAMKKKSHSEKSSIIKIRFKSYFIFVSGAFAKGKEKQKAFYAVKVVPYKKGKENTKLF